MDEQDRIRVRAYRLFLSDTARTAPRALDDWLKAEKAARNTIAGADSHLNIVYNLTFDTPSFNCGGYTFRRLPDYDALLGQLFQRGTVRRSWSASTTSPLTASQWVVDRPQRPGVMAPTYEAEWVEAGPEPESVIYREATRLFDILLLWSLWGGEHACTGKKPRYLSPTFFGDLQFKTKEELRAAIHNVVLSLTSQTAEQLDLHPSLFLLLESYCTEIANYQTLFVSPVVDALASNQKLTGLSEPDQERLAVVIADVRAALKKHEPKEPDTDSLWRNVLGRPFESYLGGLGQPAAVDKLCVLFSTSPAIVPLGLSSDVIESHARAFNQFRNATLHYAGLPKDVKLAFGSGKTHKIKRNASRAQMLRALMYYNQAFQDFLLLHFSLLIGTDFAWGSERILETLRGFFVEGLYNGHDWIHEAFMDQVVGEPVE